MYAVVAFTARSNVDYEDLCRTTTSSEEYYFSCFEIIAYKTGHSDFCNQIQSTENPQLATEYRDICLYNFALKFYYSAACRDITDSTIQRTCTEFTAS